MFFLHYSKKEKKWRPWSTGALLINGWSSSLMVLVEEAFALDNRDSQVGVELTSSSYLNQRLDDVTHNHNGCPVTLEFVFDG